MAPTAVLSVLVFIAYPVWVHVAVVMGLPMWGAVALPAFYLAQRLLSVDSWRLPLTDWIIFAVLTAAVGVGWSFGRYTVIYVPPVVITGMIFLAFARTLIGEGPPLATRLARAMGGTTPEVERYTRRVTWVWTLLLGAMLAETIVLPAVASDAVWSLFCNLLNYIAIAGFMIGELVYRKTRFQRPYTLAGFIRRMARTDFKNV